MTNFLAVANIFMAGVMVGHAMHMANHENVRMTLICIAAGGFNIFAAWVTAL